MTRRLAALAMALAGLMAGTAGRAEAGLILGSTAQFSFTSAGFMVPDRTITLADPGVEFARGIGKSFGIFADLTATTIEVGFGDIDPQGRAGGLSTFTITGLKLDPGERIVGLSVLADSRNAGTTSYSVTDNSITISFSAWSLGPAPSDADDTITYTILTGPTAVPEPSTLISGGIGGVVGLGLAWRRRRARTAVAA